MSTAVPMSAPGVLSLLPPLSLYIHFPWCIRKCPYCDFNSHERRDGIDEADYVSALLTDLTLALPKIWGRQIRSVFIGGGTPSLLSASAVEALLSGIRARVKLDPEAEITLEANPGTVDVASFEGYRSAGINRLSLGVQSFNTQSLVQLGRIHNGNDARRAVEISLSHFTNVNVDLMYALPAQSFYEALDDIDLALRYGVTHLSAYQLTIEPNTLFYRYPPANLPSDDVAAEMQEAIEGRMHEAGFIRYEVSAFARPQHMCRHNLNYWQFGDYLGVGAGAHSKISSTQGVVREMRVKQPLAYLKAVAQSKPVQSHTRVTARDLPFEFMMNGLRLATGIDLKCFSERTGLPYAVLTQDLKLAQEKGWLTQEGTWVRASPQGYRFLNDLLTIFLKKEA